jgi:hypothetical protein
MTKPIFILAAAALVMVGTGCGHGTSQLSAKEASKLVLDARDLKAPFSEFSSAPTFRLDTAGTPRQNPKRFGRKGGWVTRLNRPGAPNLRGPLVVASTVDVFGSVDGAKSDFDAYHQQFARGAPARSVHVPAIGDGAFGVTSLQPGAARVRTFVIVWRERNATASLTVNGFEGKIGLADALRLARMQERKLAKA